MNEVTKYKPGAFSFAELVTSDGNRAKSFYGELLGWSFADQDIGEGMVYSMAQIQGKAVASSYQMNEEQKSRGVHPHWNSYVTVDSADEAAAKVKSLGGTVLMEPFDVFDAGRMAQFQDPTGAVLAVWQPNQHIGSQVVNDPGCLCWNELYTHDPGKAKDFYTGLFGWGVQEQDMGDVGVYYMFTNGERMNGGMMKISPEMGDIPPNWLVYFTVEDCDRSVKKAKSMGAHPAVPPTDIPDIGRFSTLVDPQGAAFSVIKLNASEPYE